MADDEVPRNVRRDCPECGGARIDVELGIGLGFFVAPYFRRRQRRWNMPLKANAVLGVGCVRCGLLALYAGEPELLRSGHQAPEEESDH